ncbi:flagellar filament capping protein FliD [Rahnella perminowiae]|uniref:Flagellar hook-associated protein 2 n=1 Tax=Rahnella perminowiae TaxID=2816244 RepID=A0ABS6L0T1_9GAMM|nr:flagellar filament capping protein FliD [Rahnella perminowiae]MBU9835323.1 flagellar filament capping protein FliD [Rahnella perminowiae]UJD89642.1 flagellar filament capping protein FliD [Rahnella aquatilis]
MATSGTISSLGIGSGLNLSDLLDNLTTAEKTRLTPITKAQSSYSAQLTAYGTLQSAVQTFADAATALASPDAYGATTATSSNTSAFNVTTTTGAAAGKYSVSVTQLAASQALISASQTSNTAALGTTTTGNSRTLTISQGDGSKPLSINLTDDQTSLTGVRDAINKAGGGVTASIVKVSDSNYKLVLSSNNTGTDSEMTVAVTGDDQLNNIIGYNSSTATGAMTQKTAATNAQLTFNGIDLERQSNSISDIQDGITLNLTDTTASAATLTITKNTNTATTAINTFVTAYNALQDTFASLTKFTATATNSDSSDSSNGALLGDSTLRTIQTQLKSALGGANGTGSISTLASIGITTDPTTGKLTVDSTKLNTALTTNTGAVQAMMVGDGKTTGVMTNISKLNGTFLNTTTGTIANAETSVNNTLKNLTKQYNAVNDSITATIDRYKTQFTALDVAMTKLNSTSTYLTQQFATTSSSSLGQ